MQTLAQATLSATERRVLDRFVELLRAEFGQRLRSAWLYGSRARGERPRPESDVDVLVVVDRELPGDFFRAVDLMIEAAEAEGANPVFFSAQLYGAERVRQRRELRSFFMLEVDRDRIVLFGEP